MRWKCGNTGTPAVRKNFGELSAMELERREVLATLAAPLIMGSSTIAHAQDTTSPVQTRHGPVVGQMVGRTHSFRGIPYGAPTSGANRFMPPRPPQAWSAPLRAFDHGPAAPQSDPDLKPVPGAQPESEDCLTLNVWTPALGDGGKRPVMVWLHGGGLWRLSAAGDHQDGARFAARHDVVMVSPHHRLGVLAHAYLEEFDSVFAGSSHAGILDLVQALEWVRDNIEAFGGDPDNVTIFGQSGGGQKISYLMAMPAAKGLFHKVALQSGPAPLALERPYARQLGSRLLNALSIPESRAREIQSRPVADIMRAYHKVHRDIGGFGVMGVIQDVAPVVDGTVLPQHPFWNGASSLSRDIPMLIGNTRTEMTGYFLTDHPDGWKRDFAAVTTDLQPIFGADAERLVSQYRKNHPEAGPWEVDALIRSDWPTRLFTQRIADEQLKLGGAKVWMYRMDWQTKDRDGLLMSPHAIDIPFVLDTIGGRLTRPGQLEEQKAMVEQMSLAWASFARDGRPHGDTFPEWAPYDSTRRPTMIFNVQSRMVDDPDGSDLEAMRAGLDRYTVVAGGVTSSTRQGEDR